MHRNVVIGACLRGSWNIQKNETQNVILLVLVMVLGSLGDTYPRVNDYGSQSDDTGDLRKTKLQEKLFLQM